MEIMEVRKLSHYKLSLQTMTTLDYENIGFKGAENRYVKKLALIRTDCCPNQLLSDAWVNDPTF